MQGLIFRGTEDLSLKPTRIVVLGTFENYTHGASGWTSGKRTKQKTEELEWKDTFRSAGQWHAQVYAANQMQSQELSPVLTPTGPHCILWNPSFSAVWPLKTQEAVG